MVAHLDSVTSLAVDQHGLYLISGSHDCSIRWLGQENNHQPQSTKKEHLHYITYPRFCLFLLPVLLATLRLWNLESKTCVQEITAHRKKFDESIFDVAFHPSRPYIARYCQVLQSTH